MDNQISNLEHKLTNMLVCAHILGDDHVIHFLAFRLECFDCIVIYIRIYVFNIPLKPYLKDIYCVINLISHNVKVLDSYNPVYWVITVMTMT